MDYAEFADVGVSELGYVVASTFVNAPEIAEVCS